MVGQVRENLVLVPAHPNAGQSQVLRADEHSVLLRRAEGTDGTTHLVLAPSSDQAPRALDLRLEHEFALRERLHPAWAVIPTELAYERGRRVLYFEDPKTDLLSERIRLGMDEGASLRLAIGIAEALTKVHEAGLLHGDVRPSNVFVDPTSGAARLTGFASATYGAKAPPEPGAPSLAHMSPERTGRMNRAVDARSDLYSYGVTLYEMLSGQLPFAATSPMEWVHCHLAKPPVALHERVADISPALAAIVLKLLAKAPEERYQTATGVAADLRRCLSDGSAAGRGPAFPLGREDVPERLSLPVRRYGRSSEVAELLAAYDHVAGDGASELLLVSGPSGIGKSMVVHELDRELAGRSGAFAAGKFDQFKAGVPYAPLAHAFGTLVRRLLTKPEAELAAWREVLTRALGASGQLVCDMVPELELVIGPQPPVAALPTPNARHRFHSTLRQFLAVFARPEHPLAVFLDDLQWLDAGTLEFLEHVVTHPDVRHLLIVGAYRSNEVEAGDPLLRAVERIEAASGRVRRMELAPLGSGEAAELLTDALRAPAPEVEPLARMVSEKTAGNPFFVKQFIHELSDARLLSFDASRGAWRWDLDQIRRRPVTDNVVHLIIQRIDRLPSEVKPVLGVMACFGTGVSAEQIALVADLSASAVEQALEEAARAGLIGHGDAEYFFVHDRVEEAAHRLIGDEERPSVHLRIARVLSEATAGEMSGELLFDVVHHLQRGSSQMSTREERLRLAELLLASGGRARSATAFATAHGYFAAAERVLGGLWDDPFEHRPELAFAAAFNQAECELHAGDIPSAEPRLSALSARKLEVADLAAVTSLRIGICMRMGDFGRGVALGLDYLERAGSPVPAEPTDAVLDAEYRRICDLLAGRPWSEVGDLPLVVDAAHGGTLGVIFALQAPSLFGHHPNLHNLLCCRLMSSSLEHGLTPHSAVGFIWYGQIVGPRFGDYASSQDLGRAALKMVDQHRLEGLRACVLAGLGCVIDPWSKPFHACLQHLRDSYDEAVRTGDLVYTLSGFQIVSNRLASGHALEQVEREAEQGLELATKLQSLPMVVVLEDQLRLVRSLRGTSGAYPALSDASRDEATFEAGLATRPGMPLPDCWYWIRKLKMRVIANDPEAAIVAARNARELLWVSPSNVDVAEHHFYAALAHVAMHGRGSPAADADHRAAAAEYQRQLQVWATHCHENFDNRRLLVDAEIARIDGRELAAQRLYEDAIRSAHVGGFVHVEALASEMCARFYESRDYPLVADAYLRRARDAYARWGAHAKVAEIDGGHRGLVARPDDATTGGLQHLDLATVLRVSEATSQEIILDRLVHTLMTTALENAGATRGVRILVRKGELEVSAQASTDADGIRVEQPRARLTEHELPLSIVNYVRRTRTSVLLDDASHAGSFSDDPYLRRGRSRSILCLPLVKQAELVGLLHLENDSASQVFTPQRFAVLALLASQAAMTIDNALLYAELRQAKAYMSHAERLGQTGTFSWKPGGGPGGGHGGGEVFWSDELLRILGTEGAPTLDAMITRIHPEEREQFEALVADPSHLEAGVIAQRLLMPDGSTRHVTILARGLADADGGIQYVGAIRDVTEVKRSEEALQRTQAALADVSRVATLGEMAAAIAHEVNQPLGAIGLNVGACLRWLRKAPANVEEASRSAERIARDATRANDVIVRLRALFSRSTGERAPVDLNEAIGEVVTLTRSQVQRSSATLRTELSVDLPLISGDRVQLQQVILNLVVNAAEALREVEGRPRDVEIRTAKAGSEHVEVTVRDTGTGVPADRVAHIFDAFYTTKQSGMWMGLSICKTVVESHGGELSVASTDATGTTFRLSLPLRQAGSSPSARATPAP
jgi:predicted ATPase/signal transduction histidine kinase